MEFWEPLLAMPVLPATLLLMLVVFWSLLTVLGGAVFHGHHWHLDAHADGDAGDLFSSARVFYHALAKRQRDAVDDLAEHLFIAMVAASVLFLLAIDVPLMGQPGTLWSMVLLARNVVVAGLLTKLVTRPFRGWYMSESISSQSLIGQECEICSWEATPEYGQVRFKTDGAPLLLNVRTDGADLPKGTRVWITHYDAARRAYIVSPTSQGT